MSRLGRRIWLGIIRQNDESDDQAQKSSELKEYGVFTLLKMKLKLMDRRKIQETEMYEWHPLARKILIKKKAPTSSESRNEESGLYES